MCIRDREWRHYIFNVNYFFRDMCHYPPRDILALSSHINYVLLTNKRLARVYNRRSTTGNLSVHSISRHRAFNIAPVATSSRHRWSKRTFHARCLPVCFAKQITGLMSPVEARNCATQQNWNSFLYQYWKNTLKNIPLFTLVHGSKEESGVGSAFVVEDASHYWTLPRLASVYTCDVASSSILWTAK